MCQRFTLHVGLMLLLSWVASATNAPNPVFTGTVNIVLANGNGIVVLTDSNQTASSPNGERFISPYPGQKLFRIDDRTVCTIAGFGSNPFPDHPELTTSAASVLDRYSQQLQSKGGTHSFREKLTSLEFLFDHLLAAVGNLHYLDSARAREYGFELILAGYDTDGTAKIGKFVFDPSLSDTGVFEPVLRQPTEKTVGRELVYEKAGIGGPAVENILDHPAQLADEPEIGRYTRSKFADRGSSLTIADMEALAKSLARHSSLVNTVYAGRSEKLWPVVGSAKVFPVGGPDQTAIIGRSSIESINQPTLKFEPRRLAPPAFIILMVNMMGQKPDTPLLDVGRRELWLVLKSSFQNGLVHVDGAYYFEDSFTSVTISYDGGVLGFDRSNRVTDCVLVLGPNVDRKSAAVQELIARFPWKKVQ